MTTEGELVGSYMATVVSCAKHGEHSYIIQSTIPNHKGAWCQICWLETLGPPLPSEQKSVPLYADTEESA